MTDDKAMQESQTETRSLATRITRSRYLAEKYGLKS